MKALEMIRDAGAMWLWDAENNDETVLSATPHEEVFTAENESKSLVLFDTDAYRGMHDNRTVKKTLTIPNWLNTEGEKAGVNFSQILQDGLKSQLGLK